MICMRRALDDCVIDLELKEGLLEAFGKTADHMINSSDEMA